MSSENEQNPALLAKRAAMGDREAFERIYKMYLTPVFRFVFYKVKQRETAEDITQTVFMKAFRDFDRYEDYGKPPLAYFFTIAKNQVIDFWRKKKEILPDDNQDFFDQKSCNEESFQKNVEDKIEKEKLLCLVKELPDLQRESLLLRFVDDLPGKEIARLLNKSESAIRKAQSRGLQTLRDKIQNNE